MTIRDYMTAHVITANPRDGLHQTMERMHERRIRHMPVIGEDGKLIGIISDRDLRRPEGIDHPGVAGFYALDNTMKVQEAMTRKPVTVEASHSIDEALRLFIDRKYGTLPVLDQGKLVGVLSPIDLLRAFRDSRAATRPL